MPVQHMHLLTDQLEEALEQLSLRIEPAVPPGALDN